MTAEPGTISNSSASPWRSGAVLILVLLPVLMFAFRSGLAWMLHIWEFPEYNHCYLIPLIALFLLATRAKDVGAVPWPGSWIGIAMVAFGYLLLLMGQLSTTFMITQIGFLIALIGVVLAVLGVEAVKRCWPALVYLFFMVPLPDFLQVKLSASLQLLSSAIGVSVLRFIGQAVYLEGNVIDLGNYQLAVAEACSGLRYLFPLLSFGFLCAVLYQGRWWQRTIICLSAIPITVLMNSLRIAIIGILVNNFGPKQAEGFLHFFEGWVVFMICVAILFAEMFVIARLSGRKLLRSLHMQTPPLAEMRALAFGRPAHRAAYVAAAVAVVGTLAATGLAQRVPLIPQRASLATFPLVISGWHGTEQPVESIILDTLEADDTFLAVYAKPNEVQPVAIWLAYYDSQRDGKAVHSPSTCIPGGGWEFESLEEIALPNLRADGGALPVNRAVIRLGDERQLVYFWFSQRGRMLTNEYMVKWYIFQDSIQMNRSDGALVRLTTFVDDQQGGVQAADQRLQEFARAIDPKLAYFLPQKTAVLRVAKKD